MSRFVLALIACVFTALVANTSAMSVAGEETAEELLLLHELMDHEMEMAEGEVVEDRTFLYNLWSNGVSCSSNSTICSSYSGYTTCRNFIFKGKYCSKY